MPDEFNICNVTNVFNSFCPIESAAIIDSVMPSTVPVVITVPVSFGKVTILSAVGSADCKNIWNAFGVAPSNEIPKLLCEPDR